MDAVDTLNERTPTEDDVDETPETEIGMVVLIVVIVGSVWCI